MASFAEFALFVAGNEKTYQANPLDDGNYIGSKLIGTNRGVTPEILQHYLGHEPTVTEMKSLTETDAFTIYREYIWNPMLHGDQIVDQHMANTIGDMVINSGKNGIRLANTRLFLMGYPVDQHSLNTELRPDGIAALNQIAESAGGPGIFVNSYDQDRLNYYDSREKHDTFSGWDARVYDNFPENKQVVGWAEEKEMNYYLTPANLQYVVFHGDLSKMDGKLGEGSQEALSKWQQAQEILPTAYLDAPTRELLLREIMAEELTHAQGDINKALGEMRDMLIESRQEVKEVAKHGLYAVPDRVFQDEMVHLADPVSILTDHQANGHVAVSPQIQDNATVNGISDSSHL